MPNTPHKPISRRIANNLSKQFLKIIQSHKSFITVREHYNEDKRKLDNTLKSIGKLLNEELNKFHLKIYTPTSMIYPGFKNVTLQITSTIDNINYREIFTIDSTTLENPELFINKLDEILTKAINNYNLILKSLKIKLNS